MRDELLQGMEGLFHALQTMTKGSDLLVPA